MLTVEKNRLRSGQKNTLFTRNQAESVRSFHKKIPGYSPTPMVKLESLAERLGVKGIYVKDESYRFGLNAFKVLGGSYALGKALADKLNVSISEIDFSNVAAQLSQPLTFATATAGNHGTGVAWAAREMGQNAVVYMPAGAASSRVKWIESLGAECIVTDKNYDDTVRFASEMAEKNSWMLVQDTAWSGYEQIPTWISQGYMTMAAEALDQLSDLGVTPSHIMLQAGVGAMAGGVLGYFADAYGPENFKAVISEPDTAACLYQSVKSATGETRSVVGELNSIMSGLACGEVNPVTWGILRDCGDYFVSASDDVSATGMRILANPLNNDQRVVSGESGAISLGVLYALAKQDKTSRSTGLESIGISDESVILLFSTEGDTNRERYEKIVWEGAWPLS